MKLENQLVSKELAKQMKELGFKQESLFYWVIVKKDKLIEEKFLVYKTYVGYIFETGGECSSNYIKETYPAYTVAELVSMLLNISNDDIIITKEVDNVADFLANKLIINH